MLVGAHLHNVLQARLGKRLIMVTIAIRGGHGNSYRLRYTENLEQSQLLLQGHEAFNES